MEDAIGQFAIMVCYRSLNELPCIFVLDREFCISGHDDRRPVRKNACHLVGLLYAEGISLKSVIQVIRVDVAGGQAATAERVERCRSVKDPQTFGLIVDIRRYGS